MTSLRRRAFDLTEVDREFLERRAFEWEAVLEGGTRRVVVHSYPIPIGYNVPTAAVNVRLEGGYPDTPIDMAYFFPHLSRADGKPIGALTPDPFDGKDWQRWSRHRTPRGPWRPGEDCLETHLLLVDDWLARELLK